MSFPRRILDADEQARFELAQDLYTTFNPNSSTAWDDLDLMVRYLYLLRADALRRKSRRRIEKDEFFEIAGQVIQSFREVEHNGQLYDAATHRLIDQLDTSLCSAAPFLLSRGTPRA